MEKRLIYYLYVAEDFFERKANLYNLECLRKYAEIFDYADFYLSLDDTSNYDLISKVENIIINFGFKKNISFNIHQNDSFRESAVFKEVIVDNLENFKELIFFAHGKGYTNLEQYDEVSMLHWIAGCYYLSLNYAEEAEALITGMNPYIAFGSFPLVMEKKNWPDDFLEVGETYIGSIKYMWCFSGTFFWLNPPKLVDHMEVFRQKMPLMFDRYYSEKFLGNVMSYKGNATGHNFRYLYSHINMYNDGIAPGCVEFINHENMDDYNKFFDEVKYNVEHRYGE